MVPVKQDMAQINIHGLYVLVQCLKKNLERKSFIYYFNIPLSKEDAEKPSSDLHKVFLAERNYILAIFKPFHFDFITRKEYKTIVKDGRAFYTIQLTHFTPSKDVQFSEFIESIAI